MGHEFRIDWEDDTPPVHRPLYKLSLLELEEAHKLLQCGRPPRLGPATRSSVQGEMVALVGPITPKAEFITDQKRQNYNPVTISGIYSHSIFFSRTFARGLTTIGCV